MPIRPNHPALYKHPPLSPPPPSKQRKKKQHFKKCTSPSSSCAAHSAPFIAAVILGQTFLEVVAVEHSLKHPSEQTGSAAKGKGATPKVMVQLREEGREGREGGREE